MTESHNFREQGLDFAFLTDRYDFELERKEKLTAALALPVGVLAVLGSGGIAMVRSFTYRDPTLNALFLGFLFAGLGAFSLCLWFLAHSYIAQKYVYLPLLAELKRFEDEMMEYASVMAGGESEVRDDYERELRRRIIAAADTNTLANDWRSRWLHWSRITLFVTVVFAYIAGIFYMADQVRFAMPTQEAPKPASQATTPQGSAPQKPSFPENRIIKEGREPGPSGKK